MRGQEKIPVQVDEGRTLMEAARDFSSTNINEIPADCSGCCEFDFCVSTSMPKSLLNKSKALLERSASSAFE